MFCFFLFWFHPYCTSLSQNFKRKCHRIKASIYLSPFKSLLYKDFSIEYAYYDVDTAESATKPMVVHADAGYHRTLAECAAIAPGCMMNTNLLC